MDGNELMSIPGNRSQLATSSEIENKILEIRGKQVLIDRDLAVLYGVETKALNQAVKRNKSRFPERFCFQLENHEKNELVTNCDRFKKMKHSSVLPHAFTEQGVAMLSTVLKSSTAVEISIRIMDAFVEMRKFMLNNAQIFQRISSIERKQLESEEKFEYIFKTIEEKSVKKKQGIFFDQQIYDAYSFIIDIIKRAKTDIVLIDGYVNNEVLDMLSKKNPGVNALIYTYPNAQISITDVNRFNAQYPKIEVKTTTKVHDRYLIIDKSELYTIGASLKDLGKKCFSFMLMNDNNLIAELLNRIK